MIAARAFAALVFLGTLVLLILAHRRLRERARLEQAEGLLREAFEELDTDTRRDGNLESRRAA